MEMLSLLYGHRLTVSYATKECVRLEPLTILICGLL